MRTLGNYDFILHFSCTVALRVKTEHDRLCVIKCCVLILRATVQEPVTRTVIIIIIIN